MIVFNGYGTIYGIDGISDELCQDFCTAFEVDYRYGEVDVEETKTYKEEVDGEMISAADFKLSARYDSNCDCDKEYADFFEIVLRFLCKLDIDDFDFAEDGTYMIY